jgi:hypothetical protein
MRRSNLDPFTKLPHIPKTSTGVDSSSVADPITSPAGHAGGALSSAPPPAADSSSSDPQPLTLSNGLSLAPRPALMRALKYLPGAFEMPFDAYLERPELSRSTLDEIKDSPRAFQHVLEHGRPDSDSFTRGRVIHRLLLEPKEFWRRTVVWTGGSKSKGKGSKTKWAAFQAAAKAAGQDVVSPGFERWLRDLEVEIRHSPLAQRFLAGATTEAAVFFERDGVKCKARADVVAGNEDVIVDIKTTWKVIRKFAVSKELYELGIHRQADWYLDGFSKATGRKFKTFKVLAIQVPTEKQMKDDVMPPVDFAVIDLTDGVLEDGKFENDQNLSLYKRCSETGSWPGYAPVAELVVERPSWRA